LLEVYDIYANGTWGNFDVGSTHCNALE